MASADPQRDQHGFELAPTEPEITALCSHSELIGELRVRLSDVSWWMRYFSHQLACRANREDCVASKSSANSASGKYWWILVLCVLPIVAGLAIEFWAYTEERRTAGRAKPFPAFLAMGLIVATVLHVFAGLASMGFATGSSDDPPFRNLAWTLLAIAVLMVVIQWGFVFLLFMG